MEELGADEEEEKKNEKGQERRVSAWPRGQLFVKVGLSQNDYFQYSNLPSWSE